MLSALLLCDSESFCWTAVQVDLSIIGSWVPSTIIQLLFGIGLFCLVLYDTLANPFDIKD